MSEKQRLAIAVVFLVVSLGLLSTRVVMMRRGDAPPENTGADASLMDEMQIATVAPRAAALWTAPNDNLVQALSVSPFLAPAQERGVQKAKAGSSRRRWPTRLYLTGVRVGPPSSVVINNRILAEGEWIAGWRVASVRRDWVTLRNADGKKRKLKAPSHHAK